MRLDILDETVRLRAARQPFALATVVAAQAPTSATPGARAIVTPDGKLTGWVGGSCAQPTVIRQALEALSAGTPRLVVLSPEPNLNPKPGVMEVPMTCASQGELQIYVEPFLPKVQLVIIGSSPVARTLSSLGALMDFEVYVSDPDADGADFPDVDNLLRDVEALESHLSERSIAIVATIGQYDEDALVQVLSTPAAYVGLVASQKRTTSVLDYLRSRGLSPEQLARVRRPEGLASKTVLPAEIAFSVMAELLDVRRKLVTLPAATEAAAQTEAIDPICGMTVTIDGARHKTERDGQMYYFCCAGCQAKFEAA